MKKGLTHVLFVLDRSGSMSAMCKEAIDGFNKFVEEQRKLPGDLRLTLIQFNNEEETLFVDRPIGEVPLLDEKTYQPGGLTALYDALGRGIDTVGQRLASLPEEERPEKVIVATLTDGEENASKQFDFLHVTESIKHQQEKYSWEFIFVAAGLGAASQVQWIMSSSNVPVGNVAYVSQDCPGMEDAMYSMSSCVKSIRISGKVDFQQPATSTPWCPPLVAQHAVDLFKDLQNVDDLLRNQSSTGKVD